MDDIVLSFDHVGGGLTCSGDELKTFQIAGQDRNFVAATARTEGNTIVVTSH